LKRVLFLEAVWGRSESWLEPKTNDLKRSVEKKPNFLFVSDSLFTTAILFWEDIRSWLSLLLLRQKNKIVVAVVVETEV